MRILDEAVHEIITMLQLRTSDKSDKDRKSVSHTSVIKTTKMRMLIKAVYEIMTMIPL